MDDHQITVTSPLLPPLEEFEPLLKDIWQKKWITNNGRYHRELERALCDYLGVEYLSLFTNGTLPLLAALRVLGIRGGEVITTPYSFVATTHALCWNGVRPVFVDVDPTTGNLDPDRIEAAITPQTVAIMPVHVYGTPCDTGRIQAIADRHGLKVIYDAAHAFGVRVGGSSLLLDGDISTLSFHATKTYNTVEGGALICHSAEMKRRVDSLRNFGFVSETEVEEPGINSKMDELRSAYGLLTLRHVDEAIAARRRVAEHYRAALSGVPGITLLPELPGVQSNYSYFPIFVEEDAYGMSRDALYQKLREHQILGRRYFYPLISSFSLYKDLPSAAPENLPVATRLSSQVLCLPLHHELGEADVERILSLVVR